MDALLNNRYVSVMSEKDPSGFLMCFVGDQTGLTFLPGIKTELGITDEQSKLIGDRTKVLPDD
jgi:hypothetical protein